MKIIARQYIVVRNFKSMRNSSYFKNAFSKETDRLAISLATNISVALEKDGLKNILVRLLWDRKEFSKEVDETIRLSIDDNYLKYGEGQDRNKLFITSKGERFISLWGIGFVEVLLKEYNHISINIILPLVTFAVGAMIF